LLLLSPTRRASNNKTIKSTTALVGVINNKRLIHKQIQCSGLVVVITNKTRIKFHPLHELQFAEILLFFLLLLYPLRGLRLGALEYGLLMVCEDTNHGPNYADE
jgi:hypothetical protein